MQYLIMLRHGEFTSGEIHLNDLGREQMIRIAKKVAPLKPQVYSSLGPRSVQSAEIIAAELGSKNTPHQMFGAHETVSESAHYEEAFKFLAQVKDNVLVVTKGEYANPFISRCLQKHFDKESHLSPLKRGEGVIIELETGTITPLSELESGTLRI